jgi:hypothetical protein
LIQIAQRLARRIATVSGTHAGNTGQVCHSAGSPSEDLGDGQLALSHEDCVHLVAGLENLR